MSRQPNDSKGLVEFFYHPFLDRSKCQSDRIHPAFIDYRTDKASDSSSATMCHPCFAGYSKVRTDLFDFLRNRDRYFNIEGQTKPILCSQVAVDALINSGASDYVEFRCMDALYFYSGDHQLQKVPCSKADVFSSSKLSAMEKRGLMKLQQTVTDWARRKADDAQQVANAGTDPLHVLNERALDAGGALLRPQNKLPAAQLEQATAFARRPFALFLKETGIQTEPLQSIVTHCLCLRGPPLDLNYDTESGLNELWRHFDALGRFSGSDGSASTAFLLSLYGTADLVQAVRAARLH